MAAILLDSCVWGGTLAALQNLGHDTEWTGTWDKDPGDESILEYANSHQKILVTLDKDFGELAILKGKPHQGIIRLSGFRAKQMADVIHYIVNHYQIDLDSGAIITADPIKIRVRNK
jgi:predicted nuclease of predicted toxin-antitoxin system